MENATLVVLSDDATGDLYVAYVDSGEIITSTRALTARDADEAFAFHAAGGDVQNVAEYAPEHMDCDDAAYLNT
ncbi:MAG: hypothetical protein ACRDGF_00950, partial [Chloroflexota bacterium]